MAEPFSIAVVTFAGGGALGISPMPGRDGHLARDVAMISNWSPAIVATLTEADEIAANGTGSLPRLLAERGISHRRFPIVDYGTPEAGDAAWAALAADLHAALDSGRRVLVHCMGGCGRSGMIALKLMVERGESPEAALARLRLARPRAVETEGQLAWASGPVR
jgi:hypothetical protein